MSTIGKKIANEIQEVKKGISDGLGPISTMITNFMTDLEGLVEPFSKVQDAVIDLTKATGLASQGIMNMTQRLIAQNKAMSLSMSYNISNEEITRLKTEIMSGLERNVTIDMAGIATAENPNFDSDLENLIAARQIFGEKEVADIVAKFDRLGKSMGSAAKTTGKLFKQAGEYGINLTKFTSNFVNNLEMAQKYTFRDGVKGLQEMARKATEIRQDMSQVSAFAEKVGSVTGAVETAARLQVLGGTFTQLANPLSMLNESLTNMEGLQDRLIQITNGAAHYDASKKQIDMDPLMRMRLRAAAESMGVSADNLIDQAYAQARRTEIESQMEGYGGFSSEVKRLLPNVGQIDSETGLAGATINDRFETLNDIAASAELQRQLVEESRSESDDIKVIAKDVMGIRAMLSGRRSQIENQAAENKIRPGIYKGMSTLELITSTVNEGFNEEAIAGAGKFDLFMDNLSGLYQSVKGNLGAEIAKMLNSDSVEEFKGKFDKAYDAIVGGGPIRDILQTSLDKVIDFLGPISEGISAYLKPYGINMSPAKGENPNYVQGATPIVTRAEFQATKEAMDDLFIKTGVGNQRILTASQEAAGSGTVYPAFEYNKNTMPSRPVQQAEVPSNNTGARSTNMGGDINLNLNGTAMLRIVGDNGKIGEINIVDMIQNDKGFRDQLTNLIKNAMDQHARLGLTTNK